MIPHLPVWALYVQAFGVPAVALIGAVVAFISYRQRRIADNRAEWWRRVAHAIDLCHKRPGELGRQTGMQLLTEMLDDKTSTKKDARMLERVVSALIDEAIDAAGISKPDAESRSRRRRRRRPRAVS